MEGTDFFASLQGALPGGGDERICIAILDGPVDLTHPCFAGARLTQLATLAEGSGGGRALAHGTHVASVIFGQPGSPVRGIAPGCRGLLAPIFSDRGETLTCSQLDLARAILLAVDNGAHIMNISGGEISEAEEADNFLGDALSKCEAAGVLVVAATGNDGCDCVHVPAAFPTVLAVGAADRHGAPLPFSNWGAAYRANGILAPGEAIEGAAPGGGTVKRTGSSFATPIVSGFAGRMLAEQLARGEQPEPLKVRQALIGRAAPCEPRDQERCLAGQLNPLGTSKELNGGRLIMSSAGIDQEHEPSTPGGGGPNDGVGIAAGADFAIERAIERASPQAQGLG
nr:S8 family serine peptidase [Pseudaminobacter sp.]